MPKNQTSWTPGTSGNPGGRPAVVRKIRDLAQVDSEEAYQAIAAVMRDPSHKQHVAAAIAILKMAGVAMSETTINLPPSNTRPLQTVSTAELIKLPSASTTLPPNYGDEAN